MGQIPERIVVWLRWDNEKEVWFPKYAAREDEKDRFNGRTLSEQDQFVVYKITAEPQVKPKTLRYTLRSALKDKK